MSKQNTDIELISATVHELKSPLTLIQGLSSVLDGQRLGRLNRRQREYVQRIGGTSRRLLLLVDSLLHIDELPYLETRVPVQLQAELTKVLYDLKPYADERNIIFNYRQRHVPPVLAEPGSVYRVLFNIVDNALKYSPPGTTITIKFKQQKNMLSVLVSDEGVGIRPSDVKYLFQRFGKRTQPVKRNSGSSGLGLYIVKTIVEFFGGRVLATPLKKGSCFTISLPIADQLPLFE